VLGGLVARHDHTKRWRKMRLAARVTRELGFEYRPHVPRKELEAFASLELFRSHKHVVPTDWMQGQYRGESVLLFHFDPHGSSSATQTTGQLVVIFPESATALPVFQLRPRQLLVDFLGDDVSFDPAGVQDAGQQKAVERFIKEYVVVGQDEEAVRRVFTASV